jgi:hypothetical protein
MKVFVMIRYSHALTFVPGSKLRYPAQALAIVSCTRSSASSGARVIRTATGKSWSR